MAPLLNSVVINPECNFVAQPDYPLPVHDRGVQYGQGLFETIRVVKGNAPLLQWHLRRAIQGLERLGLPADEAVIRGWFAEIVATLTDVDGGVKVMLTAGSGGAGYRNPEQFQLRCRYTVLPLPQEIETQRRSGVALWRCEYRLPSNPPLAGIKHLNRLDQLMARSCWQDKNYAEGLVLNQTGDIIEATAANLFVYSAGEWLTPILDLCGVSGVMRDFLLAELLPSLGFTARETRLTAEQLEESEEIFICNALRGVIPVVGLSSGKQWPIGEQTSRVCEALAQALPGYSMESRRSD